MSEDNSGAQGGFETFENIMGRRLMQFTMECMNHEIRIKLKSSSKLYSGNLHALDPTTLSIVVHNFNGIDERAEYKVISLNQIDFFTVPGRS
jgi:small nuclear ribonucleoprotein (snRNP)-like protein